MSISTEMLEHLNGTSSVAVFLAIIARDGDAIRVWNGTRNKIVDGQKFTAFPVEPSRLQSTKDLKADNLEITTVYGELFNSKTLRSKKWQGARVEYRIMNYRDFSMGNAARRVGFLGETTIGKFSAKPELLSLSSKLDQPVGRMYQALCDVEELGDDRCKVDLTGVTETGYKITLPAHVTSVVNRQQFTVMFDDYLKPAEHSVSLAPDDLYERGKATFTSGNNDGLEALILTNIGNGFTLYLPAFYSVHVGDALTMVTGCSRTIGICSGTYANAENNRSFYSTPGRTKLIHIPEN